MPAPNWTILPSQQLVVGDFTFKFTAGLALTVNWSANIGDVLIRQLPALTANVTVTLDDLFAAHQAAQALRQNPQPWGLP